MHLFYFWSDKVLIDFLLLVVCWVAIRWAVFMTSKNNLISVDVLKRFSPFSQELAKVNKPVLFGEGGNPPTKSGNLSRVRLRRNSHPRSSMLLSIRWMETQVILLSDASYYSLAGWETLWGVIWIVKQFGWDSGCIEIWAVATVL